MQLDGTWTGYYEDTQYEDSRFPLRVEFSTRSDRLSGTMIDERIEFIHTVQEALKGLPPNSPHLRSWAESAGAFPDAIAITLLPPVQLVWARFEDSESDSPRPTKVRKLLRGAPRI